MTKFAAASALSTTFLASVAWVGGGMPSRHNLQSVRRLDGSTLSAPAIDTTVNRLMQAAKIPGVGLAILNDNRVVYLKTYGLRDTQKNLPLTVNSVMTAASLSKPPFAYLVMQLVDRGVLDLDKSIATYLPKALPEYDSYNDLAGDDRWKSITPRMLLDHTSGFPNWRRFEGDEKLHIHFEPGSRFAYSGEGIALLQMVVETVTRQPLEKLMRENIFEPFGMTRTSMVWRPQFETDFANAYNEQGRSLGPQRRQRADAAGGMQTTVADYARFLEAVLASKGLSRARRNEMLTPQISIFSKHEFPSLNTETTDENKAIHLSYGLGWGLYFSPYGKVFFKEGHDSGLRHYVACLPEAKMGMLIVTNSSNGEGIYQELFETLQKNTFTPIEWEQFVPYTQAR